MGRTIYTQGDEMQTHPERYPTHTVKSLIEALSKLDPQLPVIFRAPQYGTFGSGVEYTVDSVGEVSLGREEHVYPAPSYEDEESGGTINQGEYTQVFHAWRGVVLG